MNRYLIIKTSECRLPNGTVKSNLGDLLRTTVLLDGLDASWIWLTDPRSLPLLESFVPARRLFTSVDDVVRRGLPTDPIVLNADNTPFAVAAARRIKGEWRGFVWNGHDDSPAPANAMMEMTVPYARHAGESTSWQQALVEGMGFRWNGQDYALPRVPTAPTVDICLNPLVHPDWKSKQWPPSFWDDLARRARGLFSVSQQEAGTDLRTYVRWIASCRVVVTCDSLGLHLGSALRKGVVALAGPTESGEHDYGRCLLQRPPPRPCMPCNEPVCHTPPPCMHGIPADRVLESIRGLMGNAATPKTQAIHAAILSSDGRITALDASGNPVESSAGPLKDACHRVLSNATDATRFLLRQGVTKDREVTCEDWMRQIDEHIEGDRR